MGRATHVIEAQSKAAGDNLAYQIPAYLECLGRSAVYLRGDEKCLEIAGPGPSPDDPLNRGTAFFMVELSGRNKELFQSHLGSTSRL